jgi:hypothetical protein
LQSHCQNTSKKELRVQTLINSKGDTIIQMSLEDAKLLLNDVLEKQVVDSILDVYILRDSIHTSTIELQLSDIEKLVKKNSNSELAFKNLQLVISNKDMEMDFLNDTIKQQKREIRKQKVLKIIGFTSAVVLPIITIILIAK